MKALLLFLVLGILFQQGYAGWRLVCGVKCYWGYGCRWYCSYVYYGKRSVNEGKDEFTPLLPCKFETWDLNGNGGISFDEFEFTGHISNAKTDKKGKGLFKKLDLNGDGELSKDELDKGNFNREAC